MPARETQLPCLAGCGFSHAGLRPSAGRMQKSPGLEEAEPDEGKPVRDSDSLGSLSNKHKLSPALPSLLLDHVQDSESSSPQLRRILLINKESRATAQWSGPEAVACSDECGTLAGQQRRGSPFQVSGTAISTPNTKFYSSTVLSERSMTNKHFKVTYYSTNHFQFATEQKKKCKLNV